MSKPRQYSAEVRDRAVRMVRDHRPFQDGGGSAPGSLALAGRFRVYYAGMGLGVQLPPPPRTHRACAPNRVPRGHTTTAWRPRPSRPDSTQTVSDTPAAIHPEARPASHANSNPDTRPRQPTTTEAAEKGGRDIGACPGRVGRRGGCEAGGPPVQRLGAFRV